MNIHSTMQITYSQGYKHVNPFTLGNFAEKCVVKLVKQFSGRCRAIKSLKKAIYRSSTLRPPDPDAK